ncbi:MAG TPA: amidohydrolase family protein, partial [Thermoanaerobaculia bacterium]
MLGLVFAVLTATASPPATTLLLEHGTVYVSAEAKTRKASIVLRDGKVEFVGDAARARTLARGARRMDLTGAFVFPGWADAHGHLLGLGKSLEIADMRGAASASEAAKRVGNLAAKLPAGAWVEARGWDQNLWPGKAFPDARELDAGAGGRPVAARRVDGHAVWVNSVALERAGIR